MFRIMKMKVPTEDEEENDGKCLHTGDDRNDRIHKLQSDDNIG